VEEKPIAKGAGALGAPPASEQTNQRGEVEGESVAGLRLCCGGGHHLGPGTKCPHANWFFSED